METKELTKKILEGADIRQTIAEVRVEPGYEDEVSADTLKLFNALKGFDFTSADPDDITIYLFKKDDIVTEVPADEGIIVDPLSASSIPNIKDEIINAFGSTFNLGTKETNRVLYVWVK